MSTRAQLEEDVRKARERIDNAPADTPNEVIELWRREYDELSFQLNNLYDDRVSEFTE